VDASAEQGILMVGSDGWMKFSNILKR